MTFGKGGWSWEVAYNLPIYLRNFYTSQLSDVIEKENNRVKGPPPKDKTPYRPPSAR